MLNMLESLDHALFRAINQQWVNIHLDPFMVMVTTFKMMLPVWGAVFLYALVKYRKRAVQALLGVLISVAIADPLAAQALKPFFKRERPTFALGENNVRLIVEPQASPSFPSNHATNVFAAASIGGLILPEVSWFLYLIAWLVSYSRIYVGVHFPFDVLGGAIWGTFIGLLVYRFGIRISDLFGWGPNRRVKIPTDIPKKPRWKQFKRKKT